ncbi:3',5'-cyclic AMP phosphodiesterase CpdA [Agrobacterium vitis]|nr:3',5'-cyclic AMP phosphodiesterase CpdA [Agrobacterium vitis]MBE1436529.1 3',5'-cyclic AMP phosphodiesterase CpdA [Agrobacterium vitis]
MVDPSSFSLAVIADAHFHDVDGDFGVSGVRQGDRTLTLRTWADTRASTRVFNESAAALSAALEAVVVRGIRHVVLLGDYTDDGQRQTTASLARLLSEHEARYGTRFYALPGNHDIFGPIGRHQTKRFLQQDGTSQLVSSDAGVALPDHVLNPQMYCEGYPSGLDPMAAFGYFRRPGDLHWETPFGSSDAASNRLYDVYSANRHNHYRLMDASYLIEPQDGLWLLMIDANVFEPRDGHFPTGSEQAFIDSTSAGWNAMLRLKPFMFEWIADVAARARRLGKTLLTFSHYPVIDPFDEPAGISEALFPNSTKARRRPLDAVAYALITAGIPLHFSGHLHVEGVTRRKRAQGQLVNVAVPSLVAFPPAFKTLTVRSNTIAVDTVDLSGLPLDSAVVAAYCRETVLSGAVPDQALLAQTYGEFLRLHTTALVQHRYFPKEWPSDVVACIAPMSLAQLCADERTRPSGMGAIPLAARCPHQDLAEVSMLELVSDWYCLHQAGPLALPVLGVQRLAVIQWLTDLYTDGPINPTENAVRIFLKVFFQSMQHFLQRASAPTDVPADVLVQQV